MELVQLSDVPLARLVAVAGNLATRRWTLYLSRLGLTPAGLAVLSTLHQHGALPHREVAQHCFVRPATLTGVVDTLEKAGLVERLRDLADRRTVHLALTGAGRDRIEKINKQIRSGAPLTSVDADPAKAAVIREFLLELISRLSEGEDHGEFSG